MEECIFCQILAKKVPAKVVYEDDNCLVFLDINPRSRGMCIVAAKKHYKEFDEDVELSSEVFQSSLIVAKMVKTALQPLAVSIATMPSATPHFHVRVYPFYENEMPIGEGKPLQLSDQELNEIAEKIKSIKVEVKKPEVKEEVKEKPKEVEEKPRSKEEIEYIKRELELG